MQNTILMYSLDMFGTAVFAFSGVLVAAKKQMSFIGVLTLSAAVAIGGGTVRDLLLRADNVFWIADNNYLYVIFISCLIGVLWLKTINVWEQKRWLPVCDAIGLAVFFGIGFNKALLYNTSYLVAVILGTLTGVGGGVLRDSMAGEVPFVFGDEIYASACLAGGIVIVILHYFHINLEISILFGVWTVLIVRLFAIRYQLKAPRIKLSN